MVALEIYLVGRRKRTICSIYLHPTDQVIVEDLRDLLEQLPAPMILLGDFNAYNPLWGSKRMSTRGKMIEKILDRYNLLCLNDKEETYYRTYNSCKSTIDLTHANLMIATEYKWSKKHELMGSDHFLIIIEDDREVSTKQHKRWIIERTN